MVCLRLSLICNQSNLFCSSFVVRSLRPSSGILAQRNCHSRRTSPHVFIGLLAADRTLSIESSPMLNCVLMLQRSSARAVSDSALVRREVSRRREALAAALVRLVGSEKRLPQSSWTQGVRHMCCCCSTQRAQPPDPQARGPLSLWTPHVSKVPIVARSTKRNARRTSLPTMSLPRAPDNGAAPA